MEETEGQISDSDCQNPRRTETRHEEEVLSNEFSSVDSFGIEMTIVKVQEIIAIEEEPWEKQRRANLTQLVRKGREDDPRNATFLVGKEEPLSKFILNKSLLIFSSPKFGEILKEKPAQNNAYEIRDVAFLQFERIVQYLFGQNTWKFTTMEEACSQIEAANKYELEGFNDDLFEKLTKLVIAGRARFDEDFVCRLWVLFRNLDTNDTLAELAREYILKNAANILSGDKFLDFLPDELLDILRDDDLAVASELDVYKALLKWGTHSLKKQSRQCTTENMRSILARLIPAVRFPKMSEFEFQNYVLPLDLLLPAQTKWMTSWWNGLQGFDEQEVEIFSTQPRKYLKLQQELSPTVEQTRLDDKIKLEKSEAKVFLGEYKTQNLEHNFSLEITQLRHAMAKQNSHFTSIINGLKETQLLQEETFSTLVNALDKKIGQLQNEITTRDSNSSSIINQLKESQLLQEETFSTLVNALKTEVSELRSKNLDSSSDIRKLNAMVKSQDNEIITLSINSNITKKVLKKSLSFQQSLPKSSWFVSETQKKAENMLKQADEFLDLVKVLQPSGKFVCTVVLRNDTSLKFDKPLKGFWRDSMAEYRPMPAEILQNKTDTFGFQSDETEVGGLFSYCIGENRLVVKYCVKKGHNDCVIGFAPANIPVDQTIFEEMRAGDWSKCSDKKKAKEITNDLSKDLKVTVEFGSLGAVAEMITGEKALLSIVVSNV